MSPNTSLTKRQGLEGPTCLLNLNPTCCVAEGGSKLFSKSKLRSSSMRRCCLGTLQRHHRLSQRRLAHIICGSGPVLVKSVLSTGLRWNCEPSCTEYDSVYNRLLVKQIDGLFASQACRTTITRDNYVSSTDLRRFAQIHFFELASSAMLSRAGLVDSNK